MGFLIQGMNLVPQEILNTSLAGLGLHKFNLFNLIQPKYNIFSLNTFIGDLTICYTRR